MKGEPAARLLALALLSALACGAQQPTAEAPDQPVSRVEPAVVRDFYADYLDNDYSKFCLRSPADFLVDGLEKPEKSYDLLEEELGRLDAQMRLANHDGESVSTEDFAGDVLQICDYPILITGDSAVEDGFDVGVEPRLPTSAEPGDHEEDEKRTGQRHGGGQGARGQG